VSTSTDERIVAKNAHRIHGEIRLHSPSKVCTRAGVVVSHFVSVSMRMQDVSDTWAIEHERGERREERGERYTVLGLSRERGGRRRGGLQWQEKRDARGHGIFILHVRLDAGGFD